MAWGKDIALPTTLSDLLDARERAVTAMSTARAMVKRIEDELKQFGPYLYPRSAQFYGDHQTAIREMDRAMWRRSFDLTGFKQLMDTEAVTRFEADLDKAPPAFTEENVRSTFLSLHQEAGAMFRRGIVNVFRNLSRNYQTNTAEPFRLGEKIICNCMVTNWHSPKLRVNYSNHASDRLNDIDRVFRTVDGQDFTPRGLEIAINAAWAEGGNAFENEYFKIKGFKKGSMHIWFKRTDLLEKINELIAEHYGENKLAS